MISDVERYQGVVLRQIVAAYGGPVRVSVVDRPRRVDAFSIESAAIQIKYSSKRLSPWQFTFLKENMTELAELRGRFDPVWAFFVCGGDGVVGMSHDDLVSIAGVGHGGAAWIRVERGRRSMYRISGSLGDLPHAVKRGVGSFLSDAHLDDVGGAR